MLGLSIEVLSSVTDCGELYHSRAIASKTAYGGQRSAVSKGGVFAIAERRLAMAMALAKANDLSAMAKAKG
jgi:hypothetical protein